MKMALCFCLQPFLYKNLDIESVEVWDENLPALLRTKALVLSLAYPLDSASEMSCYPEAL